MIAFSHKTPRRRPILNGLVIVLLLLSAVTVISLPYVRPVFAALGQDGLAHAHCDSSCTTSLATGNSFTTTNAADVIIAYFRLVGASATVSSISTTGITWQGSARKTSTACSADFEEWYGTTTTTLSNAKITATLSASPTTSQMAIFGVSGANTSSPFDSNAAIPALATDSTCATSVVSSVSGVSISNANDFVFAVTDGSVGVDQTAGNIAGSASTLIDSLGVVGDGVIASEYRIVSSTFSSQSCAFGTANSNWHIVCDAIKQKVTVTQPITITPANSYSSSDSATVSTCSPSPSTVAMDGASHSVTVDAGCSVTLTVTISGNAGYSFAGNATTKSFTSCASGTCGGQSFTVYRMYKNRLEVDSNSQAQFDTGLTWTITCAHSDTSAGNCNLPSSGTSSAVAVIYYWYWTNYNQAITFPASATGAPTNSRWRNAADGTSTKTPTTGGNTYTIQYWKQWTNTFKMNPNNPTTWDAAYTETATGQYLGTVSSTICSISLANGGGSASCSGYSDQAQSVSLPSSFASSVAGTWTATDASSFSITAGGLTFTTDYNLGTGTVTEKVTITADNSYSSTDSASISGCSPSVTTIMMDGTQHTFTASANCVISYVVSLAGNTGYSWAGNSSSTSYTTATSGTDTKSLTVYRMLKNKMKFVAQGGNNFPTGGSIQWALTITYSDTSAGTYNIKSTAATTTSYWIWTNYKRDITIPQALSNPPANSRWYSNSSTACNEAGSSWAGVGSSGGGYTITCYSWQQWTNTYTMTPQTPATWDAAYSKTATGQSLGVASQTICSITLANGGGAASCSGYSDNNQAVTLPSSFASSVAGNWVAQGTNSFTITAGGATDNVNYKLLTGTVSAPVVCKIQESGAPSNSNFAVTVSSGTESPTPITCSAAGTSTTLTIGTGGITVTVTAPAAGTYTRYQSNASTTSVSWAACASGTCNTERIYFYYEVANHYVIIPQGPITWDANYTVAVTGTLAGTAGSTLFNFKTIRGDGAEYNYSVWSDYGKNVSYPYSFNSGFHTVPQLSWQLWVEPHSFAPTSGNNFEGVSYFEPPPKTTSTTTTSSTTTASTTTTTTSSATVINNLSDPPNLDWLVLLPIALVILVVVGKKAKLF